MNARSYRAEGAVHCPATNDGRQGVRGCRLPASGVAFAADARSEQQEVVRGSLAKGGG